MSSQTHSNKFNIDLLFRRVDDLESNDSKTLINSKFSVIEEKLSKIDDNFLEVGVKLDHTLSDMSKGWIRMDNLDDLKKVIEGVKLE
jgi:hypothetical protein